MEAGRCTVAVGPRDAATDLVVSRRHTRELRELLGRRADRRDRRAGPPGPGPGHRPAAAPRAPPRRRHRRDRRADRARRGLHRAPCCASSCALAVADPRRARPDRRLAAAAVPRSSPAWPTSHVARDAAGLAAARGRSSTRGCCCSAGSSSAGPSATSATSPTARSPEDEPMSPVTRRRPRHRRGRRWSPSRRWRSAPAGCGSRAPPATSSSPRARCARGSTPRAIGGEYLSAASFLGVAGAGAHRRRARCSGTRSAGPPATSCCWSWSPPRCAASGAYTLPDFAEARLGSRRVRALCSVLVVAIGWLYLLPAVPGRRAHPARRDRRARRGSARLVVGVGRAGQRASRRDAQHHLRAGLPVLAQADRAARPGRGPARGLGRRRRARPDRRRRPAAGRCRWRRAAARASTRRTR